MSLQCPVNGKNHLHADELFVNVMTGEEIVLYPDDLRVGVSAPAIRKNMDTLARSPC